MVVDNQSTDKCASCDEDLGSHRMLVAVEGALYCSIECAEFDFDQVGRNPDEICDLMEDVDPQEIGIEMRQCCNTCKASDEGMCIVDGNNPCELPTGGICELWISWRDA